MRKMVFSPTMTGAWSVSRRRDEIPLPDGISELELVALMHGEGCQVRLSPFSHHASPADLPSSSSAAAPNASTGTFSSVCARAVAAASSSA